MVVFEGMDDGLFVINVLFEVSNLAFQTEFTGSQTLDSVSQLKLKGALGVVQLFLELVVFLFGPFQFFGPGQMGVW